MIDFRSVWLPQVLRYAELVSDEGMLRRAWLHGGSGETSVTSPAELIEQVFGDLDSGQLVKEASQQLASYPRLASALSDFLSELLAWENEIADASDSDGLFQRPCWKTLKHQAGRVLIEAQGLNTEVR